jgi:hypothetical protein
MTRRLLMVQSVQAVSGRHRFGMPEDSRSQATLHGRELRAGPISSWLRVRNRASCRVFVTRKSARQAKEVRRGREG